MPFRSSSCAPIGSTRRRRGHRCVTGELGCLPSAWRPRCGSNGSPATRPRPSPRCCSPPGTPPPATSWTRSTPDPTACRCTSRSSSPRSTPPAQSTPMPSATRPSRIRSRTRSSPGPHGDHRAPRPSPAPERSSVGASCGRSWPGSWTSRRRSWTTPSASSSTTPSCTTSGRSNEGYYDFRHQLLRDALYGSTPETDRRKFHARAGEFGTRLEGQTEVHTSLHYELAGLREQAYRSALDGAQAAARVSAHREAFWLYRRAVANMPADLTDLDRAELLDAYALEACAIEENEIGEQATWDSRQAYLAAGRPDTAARMVSGIATLWRRTAAPWARGDGSSTTPSTSCGPCHRDRNATLGSWSCPTIGWSTRWTPSTWRRRAAPARGCSSRSAGPTRTGTAARC